MAHYKSTQGFSLVELSIVLVILGLLTGGILAGQSLIRAAEIRAVSTEYARYVTAAQTFRDKYLAYPGDFRDATRFWQRYSTTSCTTNSSAAVNATSGTCDGDGDGRTTAIATASVSNEIFQFWRQLALAGLIEGTYSGLAGSGSGASAGYDAVFGTNVPPSRVSSAGWAINHVSSSSGIAGELFAIDYNNVYYFGAKYSNTMPTAGALKPEEAWGLDTKLDDGRPGRGSFIARNISTCTDAGSAAGSQNDLDADYLLTSSSVACALMIKANW